MRIIRSSITISFWRRSSRFAVERNCLNKSCNPLRFRVLICERYASTNILRYKIWKIFTDNFFLRGLVSKQVQYLLNRNSSSSDMRFAVTDIPVNRDAVQELFPHCNVFQVRVKSSGFNQFLRATCSALRQARSGFSSPF